MGENAIFPFEYPSILSQSHVVILIVIGRCEPWQVIEFWDTLESANCVDWKPLTLLEIRADFVILEGDNVMTNAIPILKILWDGRYGFRAP